MEDCTRGAGCAVLMRHPYTRGGSPHFILISNEHCISHKLFAKCGYACLSLTEASDLTSLPSGDRRGGAPLGAHLHILNTCSRAEDGYSRHVRL